MAKGKIGTGAIIALIAVVLFVAVPDFQTAVLGIFKTGDSGTSDNIWEGKCLEHDAITMTVGPSQYRYSPATSINTNGNTYDRVFINGIDKGLKDDGTTMTVSFGDEVEVYYAENSSEFYAAKSAFDVPCSAAFDSASMSKNNEHRLIAPKNLTLTVFNNDDSLKNTAANNETITTDDSTTMGVHILWPAAGGFSPYGKVYVNVYVNNSQFDDVTMQGGEAASTSTYRTKTNASASYVWYTFAIDGKSTETATKDTGYSLTFDTASSGIPTASAGEVNASIQLDDEDWYKHSKTGKMVLGPASDTRGDVGEAGYPVSYLIVFRGS